VDVSHDLAAVEDVAEASAPQQEEAVQLESVVVITDDGRTFETPKPNLVCPFCNDEFQVS
jgi:hypothetical protein